MKAKAFKSSRRAGFLINRLVVVPWTQVFLLLLLVEDSKSLPLAQMDTLERLVADYAGDDMTTGRRAIQCNTGGQNCTHRASALPRS